MLDRFDPRDEDARSRNSALERPRGSGGGGDRENVRDDDDRRAFGRRLDLPRGRLYHVHHKRLYSAIGQVGNRNRRRALLSRIDEWFERHARQVRGGSPTELAG